MKKRLTKCVAITAAISLAVGGLGVTGGSTLVTEAATAESVPVTEITDGSDSATQEEEISEAVIMDETDVQAQESISASGDITEIEVDPDDGAGEKLAVSRETDLGTTDQTAADSQTDQDIQAEDLESTEADTDEESGDNSEVSGLSDSSEEPVENGSEAQKSTIETGQLLSAPADEDINRPVIESVELLQNGQTLHEGDTVEVRVHAYDADSGIREVQIRLSEIGSEMDYQDIYAQYDESLGCYVATLELDHVGKGQI